MRQAARTRLSPLLAVGALLVGAAVAASLATPQIHRSELPKPGRGGAAPNIDSDALPAAGAPPAPSNQPDASAIHLPSWVGPLALTVLFVLLLTGAAIFVYLMLKDRFAARPQQLTVEVPVEERRAQVLAAVDAGLAELDEGDPRAAVIACWVRLEEAAAAAGTPREPGDTPGELVLRLLTGHQVSSAVLYDLAAVYRLARYATHDIDVTMRDQARAALRQLRAQLSQPAVAGPGVPR